MIKFIADEPGVLFEQHKEYNLYWVKGHVTDSIDLKSYTDNCVTSLGYGGYLVKTNAPKINKGWELIIIPDIWSKCEPINFNDLL